MGYPSDADFEAARQTVHPVRMDSLKSRLDDYAFAAGLLSDPTYNLVAMGEEAGECLGKLKKHMRDGLPIHAPAEDLAKELGDVLFYWVYACHSIGYNPETIFKMLIQKISDRKARNVQHGSGDNR